jgi:hypothetical protein
VTAGTAAARTSRFQSTPNPTARARPETTIRTRSAASCESHRSPAKNSQGQRLAQARRQLEHAPRRGRSDLAELEKRDMIHLPPGERLGDLGGTRLEVKGLALPGQLIEIDMEARARR